jgi:nicotinamidase-related amidase
MPSALIVIDVQQSFMHRPYWRDDDVPSFLGCLQSLLDRCAARDVPVLQVFHADDTDDPKDAFSRATGLVTTLPGLRIEPTGVFYKKVHSSLFARDASGRTLEQWLRDRGIDHVVITGIRTEQCCETTARHASDSGFRVSYAIDATLTFPMVAKSGRTYSAADIKERTELVLAGRFASVLPAESVAV